MVKKKVKKIVNLLILYKKKKKTFIKLNFKKLKINQFSKNIISQYSKNIVKNKQWNEKNKVSIFFTFC